MPNPGEFVDAYPSGGGDKQLIPAHWFDHPVLSKQWRKTPKATEEAAPAKAAPAKKEN